MVDLIDLCSNNSALPRTPEELRALLDPSDAPKPIRSARQRFKLKKRLGAEACEEIARRYEAGETAQVLADEFKVSKSGVLVLLRSRNVVMRRLAVSSEQTVQLVDGNQQGKTVAALKLEMGIALGSIQRALKVAGVQMRPRGFQSTRSEN